MKTYLYTKAILTVIAIALIGILFENSSPVSVANAENKENKYYGIIPVNANGSINVNISDNVDVNIQKVNGKYITNEVPVSIKECTTTIRVQE